MWFLSDLARLKAEREGIEHFGVVTDWFVPRGWRLDDRMRLVLDADINAGGKTWPICLRYPELFPNSPPSVFPRGDKSRWSFHQYGMGGELCLEYGPDNWTSDLTGVHLVQSAHRLLQGENPAPGISGTVASRHEETLGQRFRSEASRLLLTRSAEMALASIPVHSLVLGALVSAHHKEVIIHVLKTLKRADGTLWADSEVPAQFADEYLERSVPVFRIEETAELPASTSVTEFRASCAAIGFTADQQYCMILRGQGVYHYFLWEKGDSVTSLAVIPAQPEQRRIDEAHDRLKSRKIGLVGCGSVGSKMAATLTRAGVGKWLLVDDDLLLPANFVRHDLDWRDAGTHKTHSVARRLQLLNPGVETTLWQVRLGGQSSSASAEAVLKLLGDCDLIIDATANPDILNLIAAVAAVKSKPVIWAEVFGGGIGGMIGRCRPGLEPPVQYMRRAIENWFGEQGAPLVKGTRSYETGGDGPPLIADDADVSVIASHAARFAIDLLERDASIFPHAVYAIGMAAGSVFTEPFDTRPIDVGPPPIEIAKPVLSEDMIASEFAYLLELLKKRTDETPAATARDQTTQA